MRLKDRLTGSAFPEPSQNGRNSQGKVKSNEACKQFNKGHCNYGTSCIFEHKCSFCGKFGHTVLNCRKLMKLKDRRTSYPARRENEIAGGSGPANSNTNNNKHASR